MLRVTSQLFSVVVAVLLVSCAHDGFNAPKGPQAEGFLVYPTARSFDAPGRIYRVQPDGQSFGVTTVSLRIQQGNETIPGVIQNSNFSLKTILDSIGVAADAFPASAAADIARKRQISFESTDGTREFVDDGDLDSRKISAALIGIRIRPNNKYYIVRETISTKTIVYTMEKGWLMSAGLEAQFKDVVGAKTNLDWGSQQTMSMAKTYDSAMRLWYKAELVEIESPLGVGPGQAPGVKFHGLPPDEMPTLSPESPTMP